MKILMCKPDYYGIYYEINPWMNVKAPALSELSQKQWQALYETILNVGATVELVTPVEGLPDMVFTANAGLVYNDQVWLSNFLAPQRQAERKYFQRWFQEKKFTILNADVETPYFEGAGDALFLGERLIVGHGFRSDPTIYQEEFFQQFNPLVCELVDPYFYHLDTCFCPLNSHQAIWYPPAFSIESQRKLEQHYELISANDSEAKLFACNAVVINQHVILPQGCPSLVKKLDVLGFTPHTCDMSEFIKAGGACKCLTLNLSQGPGLNTH